MPYATALPTGTLPCDTTHLYHLQTGQLILHDGHLAFFKYEKCLSDRPVMEVHIGVSRLKEGEFPEGILGLGQKISWDKPTEVYNARGGWGSYLTVDLRGSTDLVVELPIAKPADGRAYTWTWAGPYNTGWGKGYWERKDFPKCYECFTYHNPDYLWCETCQKCRAKHAHKGAQAAEDDKFQGVFDARGW